MTWMVSPRQFVEAFDGTVTQAEVQRELIGLWSDVKGYTAHFVKGPLLGKVADRLGLKPLGHEFLSTDAAFVPNDEFWRVPVVIEHENAVATAGHEIYKLAHLSVPLRVLITYPWKVGKDEDEERLKGYCEILQDLGANASGQLLVVFATIEDADRESIKWRYYLYAGSEFFRMTSQGLASA